MGESVAGIAIYHVGVRFSSTVCCADIDVGWILQLLRQLIDDSVKFSRFLCEVLAARTIAFVSSPEASMVGKDFVAILLRLVANF